ncbi:MAG: hypothetical protein U0996_14095 [Planctomycetaceae bacterium]
MSSEFSFRRSKIPLPADLLPYVMELQSSYHRRSGIREGAFGLAIALEPNLRRDRVSYRGQLKSPLRFREAISALHEVVVSDLKFHARDKSAYIEWKRAELAREQTIRRAAVDAKKAELQPQARPPIRPGLEEDYERLRRQYWDARLKYSTFLQRTDPEIWRRLVPCDPVITVASDCLFFECFSADESSYGCLTVGREAFENERDVSPGTTNVDYTWDLYEHFQTLRSYRQTSFEIDPGGFEVQTDSAGQHREEKIDLPGSWLRGFLQLQSAMTLPMRVVSIGREGLYNLLAYLKRHRAAKSPRAIRFELIPGQAPQVILEPWDRRVSCDSRPWNGNRQENIRIWGRDRLQVLSRLLPLADEVHVGLLGTGLPSFWMITMGEMRFVLGLSGWTANDWTSSGALDQILPPVEVREATLAQIAGAFRNHAAQSFESIVSQTQLPTSTVAAGLNRLALLGQIIHDLPARLYRWRQVMPVPLTSDQIGGDHPETLAARALIAAGQVQLSKNETMPNGMRLLEGRAGGSPAELLIDGDGRIVRGRCKCSHHFKNGLRKGPCRHLQALRQSASATSRPDNLDSWYASFRNP